MRRRLIECVANFSEGRNPEIVKAIAAAIGRGHEVAVLHHTMDPDHHRSVITFAGSPEAVLPAAVRGVAKAVELIDLRRHTGVHPRVGAADVVPLVPVEGITLEQCAELARELGSRIWRETGVPVYFYEAAAVRPGRKRLENVRRGGFEGISQAVREDPSRAPDLGGPELHPSAGAVIVGARKFLIAFNVNLDTPDVQAARIIARSIRASSGGFPHVKALGLALDSRGQAQVSMNLTDFEQTPLHVVYAEICRLAKELHCEVAESEIIGLIPRAAIEGAATFWLKCGHFTPESVLESRIEQVLPAGLPGVLDAISDPRRATGGGSAAALAGAAAAALGMLVCRLRKADAASFGEDRQFFLDAVRLDAEAFAPLMQHTGAPAEPLLARAAEVPLLIAERAQDLLQSLGLLLADTPERLSSDAETARSLASAALRGATATAFTNIEAIPEGPRRDSLLARARSLQAWAVE